MNANVLVVDDDVQVLNALKRTLSLENSVYIAANSEAANEILYDNDIDVIISDYRLEGEIGTDLLSKVYERWPHITRITITGFRNTSIIEDSINKASVFRFITKPWSNEELLKTVREAKYRTDILKNNIETLKTIKQQEDEINKEIELLKSTLKAKDIDLYNEAEKLEKLEKQQTTIYQMLGLFSDVSYTLSTFKNDLKEKLSSILSVDFVDIRESGTDCVFNFDTPRIIRKPFSERYNFNNNLSSVLVYPAFATAYHSKLQWFIVLGRQNADFSNTDVEELKDFVEATKLVLEWLLVFELVKSGEKQWIDIFNLMPNPIVITDAENRIKILNNEARSIINGDEELKLDKFSNEIFTYDRYEFKHTDNTEFIHYFRNEKKEKDLYRQLIQSEKLGAIGMLASNLAHELNNPIGGIMAYAQLLQQEEDYKSISMELKSIEDACKRSKSIVYNLLDFSDNKKRQEYKTISLRQLVEDTLPLLNVCLKGYEFDVQVPEGIDISCRVGELQQVLFNLIVNATHAIEGNGKITVFGGENDKYTYFAVEDNGKGIPDEIKDKIFESFFTTKGKAKGTGLGLSVAKNIVEQHGGYIDLQTELGRGTKFTIYIPKG